MNQEFGNVMGIGMPAIKEKPAKRKKGPSPTNQTAMMSTEAGTNVANNKKQGGGIRRINLI